LVSLVGGCPSSACKWFCKSVWFWISSFPTFKLWQQIFYWQRFLL